MHKSVARSQIVVVTGLLGVAFTALPFAAFSADARGQLPWGATRQVVLVITPGWTESAGVMQRFERGSGEAPWRAVTSRVPVVVGKTGVAWGRGLHPPVSDDGPAKREGDRKAPAGVFRLSSAFGYAKSIAGARLPYVAATSTLECVDDPRSRHYNRIVDRAQIAAVDWKSSEPMQRRDELYRLGIVVDHNDPTPEPGRGSCIFLHVWRAPAAATVGCTAMSREAVEQLTTWLDPAAEPVLVQLPRPAYERLKDAWGLPVMSFE